MAGASSENTTPHPPGNGWQPPPKQGLRKFKTLSAAIVSILNLENRFMLLSASMSETALVKVAGTYITCMWPDKHQNYFTGTLGVDRRSIKTFFKDPSRLNVFQQIRTVDRISSRFQITFLSQTIFDFSNFDQSCGFLLVLPWLGRKSRFSAGQQTLSGGWVRIRKLAIEHCLNILIAESWLKDRLAQTGNSSIRVRRLDGNSTAVHKKKTLDDFKSG